MAIEIDTLTTGERLIRVFEQHEALRGLPDVLRVDNEPELLSTTYVDWAKKRSILIEYIEPREPNQNAYIEHFNRTYREEASYGTTHQARSTSGAVR